MEELMRVLWYYARDCRLSGCYNREASQGRQQCIQGVEGGWEKLKGLCTPEALQRVEALCDCYEELREREAEAAFVCGFRLGMELR